MEMFIRNLKADAKKARRGMAARLFVLKEENICMEYLVR